MENKLQTTQTNQLALLPQQSKRLVECLVTANPLELAKITSSLTFDSATDGTKIMRLKKILGESLLEVMIVLVSDVVGFFNLNNEKNMNNSQIIFIAQTLIEDYPTFSLEDFAMCFKDGKKGKYGKNYATFDGQILMLWVQAYDQERIEYFEQLHKRPEPNESILHPKIVEKLVEGFKHLPTLDDISEDEANYKKQKEKYFKNKILKDGQSSKDH